MFPRFHYSQKALQNILLCSLFRLFGKLHYPARILPKIKFRNILDIDSLIVNQHVYFLRRSDHTVENTFNVLGNKYTLKEDVLTYSDIPGLSLNIVGGRFKLKHLKFKLNGKSSAVLPWDGSSSIYLCDHLNNYEIAGIYSPIFIDSEYTHNLNIPYSRPYDKHLKNLLIALGREVVPENNICNFTGRLKFVPAPTNLNYWHVELKIFDVEKNEINKKSSTWIRTLCEQILNDVIAANALPQIPEPVKIPSSFYIK